MADIPYTEAQFSTARPNDAVDAEQLRLAFKELAPAGVGFPSTGAVFDDIQVFEFGDNPRAILTTSGAALDAPDIASALAIINGHDALGHPEGFLGGDLAAFGGLGVLQNFFLDANNFDEAGAWPDSLGNTTTVLNNAAGPNGQGTADTVTWDVASGLGKRQTMLGTIDGNPYTFYGFIRYAGGPGDTDLNFDLHDGPGAVIQTTSEWQRFRVEMTAGTGGDFFDITHFGSSAGDSFEFAGFLLVDGHDNHDHPYLETTDVRLTVPRVGQSVAGDVLLSGDVVYTRHVDRHGASLDAANVVEIYETADWGTAELAPDGNMRVPLIAGSTYAIMRSNIVMPLVSMPIADDPDLGTPVTIQGHYRIATLVVVDTSAPIVWGRDAPGLLVDQISFFDQSNAGAGLGVTMFDLVGPGGDSGLLFSEKCNYILLKAIGTFVDVLLNHHVVRQLFCESGFTVRTNTAATLSAAVAQTNVVYLASPFLPDVRRPPVTVIGDAGKSFISVVSVNMGKATNSAFHVDLFATGSTVFSNIGYLGPMTDGEFFRPTLVTAITEQVESQITITGFSDSVVNPGVDTTVEFASVMPFTRGQQIRIQQEAAYNGLQTIVRVAADQLSFDINVVHSTSGAANIRHTEHIVADCKFSVGETVAISGTTNYNVNQNIVAVTDTSFTFNQVFVGDDGTGTATSNGQDETSQFVTTSLTGDQKESRSIGSVVATGNATATTINTINIWESLDLGGAAVAGANIELWGQVDADTCAVTYLGAPAFNGSMVAALSATSAGGTQRFQFRVRIDGVVVDDLASVDIGNNMKRVAILAPLTDVLTSHVVDIQVRNTGGTSDVLIEDISIEIQ